MKSILKKAWLMRFAMNLWPPLLFSGIRIKYLSADFKTAKIELTLRPWNQNAVGTLFGGSLYAMTDPFYMLMILAQLGDQYLVWDKSADIDYIKPGKGKVYVDFCVNQALIDDIINNTAAGEKYLPTLTSYVKDQQGEIVAKVNRVIYIRRKKRSRER
jgi:acyl-coenzyme A thioesterase PaaI-like protein